MKRLLTSTSRMSRSSNYSFYIYWHGSKKSLRYHMIFYHLVPLVIKHILIVFCKFNKKWFFCKSVTILHWNIRSGDEIRSYKFMQICMIQSHHPDLILLLITASKFSETLNPSESHKFYIFCMEICLTCMETWAWFSSMNKKLIFVEKPAKG